MPLAWCRHPEDVKKASYRVFCIQDTYPYFLVRRAGSVRPSLFFCKGTQVVQALCRKASDPGNCANSGQKVCRNVQCRKNGRVRAQNGSCNLAYSDPASNVQQQLRFLAGIWTTEQTPPYTDFPLSDQSIIFSIFLRRKAQGKDVQAAFRYCQPQRSMGAAFGDHQSRFCPFFAAEGQRTDAFILE